MVSLSKLPRLQVARHQVCPKSCERGAAPCTLPAAAPRSHSVLFPSQWLCSEHCPLPLHVFPLPINISPSPPSRPASSLNLFQQVFSDTPNGKSPFLFLIPRELCTLLCSCHHLLLGKSYGCVPHEYVGLEVL